MREYQVNSPVDLLVASTHDPLTSWEMYLDGDLVTISFTASLVKPGLYKVTFTPTQTGFLDIVDGVDLLASIQIKSSTDNQLLQDLLDESLGSWEWDKTTGSMTLFRRDGTTLSEFTVLDSLTSASRERL